jgi:gluconate 5-dehydrogenase
MSLQLFNLEGKTALITGSSRGLGNAIARGLAQAGARVVLNGVNPEVLSASSAALQAKGHEVLSACFDVNDEATIVKTFQDWDAQGVAIDILVNNAGIQFRKPMIELETQDWQRVINTNLTSCFVIAREAAKRMIARNAAEPQRGGKIINIGSLMSRFARATIAPYSAAKGGVSMLTQSMAVEWAAYNIQANAIGPGYMVTEMNQALIDNPTFNDWVKGRTPSKRWGQPDELIGVALFLASKASSYVNGQLILVDGGMSAVL